MTSKKLSPFDYLNAINFTKEDIFDELTESYNPFMVNRGLSYFIDTIMLANEMNGKAGVCDNKLQFDYYINSVRKRKRFSKWSKSTTSPEIEAIKEYYGYNNARAEEVLKILSDSQINELRRKVHRGGKTGFKN